MFLFDQSNDQATLKAIESLKLKILALNWYCLFESLLVVLFSNEILELSDVGFVC